MSNPLPYAPASRPLPELPRTGPGVATAAHHPFPAARQDSFGDEAYDAFKDDLEQGSAPAYSMGPMGQSASRSVFTSRTRGDEGVSIMGFDADVQPYSGLRQPASFGGERSFTSGQVRPFSDRTLGSLPPYVEAPASERAQPAALAAAAPERARPAAAAQGKQSSRGRWTLCGLMTAALVGAGVGLGVYFGQIKPAREASSASGGSAAGGSTAGTSSRTTSARSSAALSSARPSFSASTGVPSAIYTSSAAFSSGAPTFSASAEESSTPSIAPSFTSSSSSTVPPAASPSPTDNTAAGLLQNGVYNLVLTKATDSCLSQHLICNDQLKDTWTVSTSNGAYTVYSSFLDATSTAGTPKDDQLLFNLAVTTQLEGNDCTYSVQHGYGITLQAGSFSGSSVWRRTLAQACDSALGQNLTVGSLCDCQYTLVTT